MMRSFLPSSTSWILGTAMLGLLACGTTPSAHAQAPGSPLSLLIHQPPQSSHVELKAALKSNTVYQLETSTNLLHWQWFATFHDSIESYPVPLSSSNSTAFPAPRFFRFQNTPRSTTNDWKNQILHPEDPFLTEATRIDDIRWIKCILLLDQPGRVYFQDSGRYRFHYDFARARIPGFEKMPQEEFDRITLHPGPDQRAVLAAVLFPPATSFKEYAIQIVGKEPFPASQIVACLQQIRAAIFPHDQIGSLYLPTFEQRASAEAHRAEIEAHGFPVTTIDRWQNINHCYAPGWATGRLRYFKAQEIQAAFNDGRLQSEDILITDGIPAETPLVAGIITLSPSTPNSHTAILAASFNIPFFHLADESERQRALQLDGHQVVISAYRFFDQSEIKVIDVEGLLTPAQTDLLQSLKQPPAIRITPKKQLGRYFASVDQLTPADIPFFGGKASHYGILKRAITTNAPTAIAFSFDLWDAFMSQILPQGSGRTLREEITLRLSTLTNDPPHWPSLKTNLATVRSLIRNTATFSPPLRQIITNALAPVMDGHRKIRFRSSTNVEDTDTFTGAGLYDSYSGCLWDDLDGDASGPSQCDPEWKDERGVFRALQQVYASFYNDGAFLERQRRKVDESQVGMAALVHHSFPDEAELANGVATVRFLFTPFGNSANGQLVTQYGPTPVANPDGSALPEVVQVNRYQTFNDFHIAQSSSLLPLGDTVLRWTTDYASLMTLLDAISVEYQKHFPSKSDISLDFEYKKDALQGLIVKQVRPLPTQDNTRPQPTFLLHEPVEYRVDQAESGDVFSNHRLKSVWRFATTNMLVTTSNLQKSIHQNSSVQFLSASGTQRMKLEGPPSTWPAAEYHFLNDTARDTWTTESSPQSRQWNLDTEMVLQVTASRSPILTQRDLRKSVEVVYPHFLPTLDYQGNPTTTSVHRVTLIPTRPLEPGAILRHLSITKTNPVTRQWIRVSTSYYWPRQPVGVIAGYTAPLVRFVETRIEGLTSEPLVLQDYYAQTYRPGHHNFTEEFIFEPRLDPQIRPSQAEELERAQFQFLHVFWRGDDQADLTVLGLDGKFRTPYPHAISAQ